MEDKEYKILIVEDVPTDAELMENELHKGGLKFVSKVVTLKADFISTLDAFKPDLILSDYKLPQFDGLSALEMAKKKSPNIPFIFVSGAMGDELAVATLKEGAIDFVLKDKLDRLMPAVSRAFHDAEIAGKLSEKVSELEKALRTMVGRELKMVELKQTVVELKEKIAALAGQAKK